MEVGRQFLTSKTQETQNEEYTQGDTSGLELCFVNFDVVVPVPELPDSMYLAKWETNRVGIEARQHGGTQKARAT